MIPGNLFLNFKREILHSGAFCIRKWFSRSNIPVNKLVTEMPQKLGSSR